VNIITTLLGSLWISL